MAPTVPAARPPVKVSRSCRLLEVDGSQVLSIAVTRGRQATQAYYHLTALPADFGPAFELRKSILDGGEVYHVNLADDGKYPCECKGVLHRDRCKHVEGLLALRRAGRL